MVLSEGEAEARLAALRRERETLDRAITDLTLFLELGRRLSRTPTGSGDAGMAQARAATGHAPEIGPSTAPSPAPVASDSLSREPIPAQTTSRRPASDAAETEPTPSFRDSGDDAGGAPGRRVAPHNASPGSEGRVPQRQESAEISPRLSETVLARRHGRALIKAALSALDEAGRPLHASEILAVVAQRGFSLPGHDPVAALNTRLWKRAGADGPLRRLGDAVYALADDEPANDVLR